MTQIRRKENKVILYPELSYKLTGIFFKVHNELGRFCKERQYTEAIEILLKKDEIPFRREKKIVKNYFDNEIDFGIPDFVIDDKIAIEIKAKRFITKDDYFQLLKYLKSKNYKLGLLVNFRNTYLKPKRIAN